MGGASVIGIRVAALLAIGAVRWASPTVRSFEQAIISIAFGHYALAFWYSRRRVTQALRQPKSAAVLLGLAVTGALPFAFGVPVAVWFLPHHVFNEVYAPKVTKHPLLASIVHALVFACLAKTRALFMTPLFWGLFAAAWVVFVVYVIASRGKSIWIECLWMAVLMLSWKVPINLFHLAGYHFAFWMIYPALTMPKRASYVLLTTVATAGMYALTLAMSREAMYAAFALLSFVHIQISLGLSAINPAFITRWWASLGRRLDEKFS